MKEIYLEMFIFVKIKQKLSLSIVIWEYSIPVF
jgi:hypothetical protein